MEEIHVLYLSPKDPGIAVNVEYGGLQSASI